MQAKQTVSYADQYPLLLEDVQHYMAQQYRIVVLAPNTAAQTSLQTLFTENHLPTVTKEPHSLMELPTAVTLILSGVQNRRICSAGNTFCGAVNLSHTECLRAPH